MEWISVKDRLPEPTDQVTVWIPEDNRVLPCWYMHNAFEVYSIARQDWFTPHGEITHWMPLPEPPK